MSSETHYHLRRDLGPLLLLNAGIALLLTLLGNTMVRSLIGRDTALAQQTLDLLNDYLRASLGRTRRAEVSLGDELALVSPLLQIARLRLGTRLRYEIVVPDELLALPLPPLLLQPLVENALEHGIEPALDGGSLRIVARRDGARLYLRVEDGGRGLQADAGEGLGLANVRQRLEALYGAAAQLALYPQQPHGVVAELCLPLAEAPSC